METTFGKDAPQNPVIKRGRSCRPSGSVSYSRHDDKASGGSPNGPALRPMLGRARGPTPPRALGGRKVVSRTGSGALAAQLLHACADHRKIVSGAGSGHV